MNWICDIVENLHVLFKQSEFRELIPQLNFEELFNGDHSIHDRKEILHSCDLLNLIKKERQRAKKTVFHIR